MDGGTFDHLTRRLAGRLTRRVGLAGALGALAGGKALDAAGRARERTRRHPGGTGARRHDAEVINEKKPCGPTAAENKCRKNKDCCTNYCKPPKGNAKTGRCRCIKPSKKCKNGQTCCGGATCQNRKCTLPPTCGATGGACTEDANCCSGLICLKGACGPCVETVCASGCAFTTVNAAYAAAAAGDTIFIGSGTHPTGIVVTKDITLTACPGVTAILEPDRVLQDADSYYVIATEDSVDTTTKRSVTLRNLTLQGTATGYADDSEALLTSYLVGLVSWTIEDCTLTKAYYGISARGGEQVITDSTFTDITFAGVYQSYLANFAATDDMSLTVTGSTFSDCDSYAIYCNPEGSSAANGTLTVTDSTFTRIGGYTVYYTGDTTKLANRKAFFTGTTFNDTGLDQSIPLYVTAGTVTLDGCTLTNNKESAIYVLDGDAIVKDTLIQGNTADADGGGIYIDAYNGNASLVVSGSTSITGNSAKTGFNGGGVFLAQRLSYVATASGTSTTNVTNNTPDQCYKFVNGNPGASGVKNCTTWT